MYTWHVKVTSGKMNTKTAFSHFPTLALWQLLWMILYGIMATCEFWCSDNYDATQYVRNVFLAGNMWYFMPNTQLYKILSIQKIIFVVYQT